MTARAGLQPLLGRFLGRIEPGVLRGFRAQDLGLRIVGFRAYDSWGLRLQLFSR